MQQVETVAATEIAWILQNYLQPKEKLTVCERSQMVASEQRKGV